MAASTYTQYYNLSQFQPNDTANWLDDYNPDMEKIDNALHELSEQTEPLQTELAALTARVETEEAQSHLQAEQIVSLQTAVNRNNTSVETMQNKVNSLNSDVDALNARVEAVEDAAGDNTTAIAATQKALDDYKAQTDPVLTAHGTSIAAAQSDINDLQNSVQNINTQLEDFSNLTETDWAAAAQVTGDLKMLTTWHNLRQIMLEGALELHDVSALEHITQGSWTSSAYALCSANGKVFNTHAPTGAAEAPNEAENYIGSAPLAGTSTLIDYFWHYDVAADVTYLLFNLRDSSGPAMATGQKTGGNLVFIAD